MRADVETDDFHARRSALWREYRYFIHNAPTCYPHIKPYVLWLKGMHYDWRLASRASRVLIGKHDFGAFCRTADRPDDAVRTVRSVSLHSRGGLVVFRIIANSYLTNMVRIAVGNLLSVASGRRDENWLRSLLEVGRDRNDSSITVPPGGLFLWNVIYK